MTQDLIPVRREDVALLLNPPAGMDYAVDAAISEATDRLTAALNAPPSAEPRMWLVEEKLPSGSVSWSTFEHEQQAVEVCEEKSDRNHVKLTPLYTHPLPSGEAVGQQARLVIEFMERETGLPFGDFIGAADRERIKAMAKS